jgi:hypothetical protein
MPRNTMPGSLRASACNFAGRSAIDAYTDPGPRDGFPPPPGETAWLDRRGNTPTHLCRIRFNGDEERWSFAYYTYAHEKYEPSFFMNGDDHGTPEEAFEASALFL